MSDTPPLEPPDPDATGPKVCIVDLSAEDDDDRVVETVRGFASLDHANAFARAYVRDSLERCRTPGASADDVLAAWRAFGEDAEIVDALGAPQEGAWQSADAVAGFAGSAAGGMERDWRAIDPRATAPVPAEDGDAVPTDIDADDQQLDEELIPPTIMVDLPSRKPH